MTPSIVWAVVGLVKIFQLFPTQIWKEMTSFFGTNFKAEPFLELNKPKNTN